MDADVLYDHNIIGRLIDTDKKNIFLLDKEFEAGAEPVKLCVLDGQLVEFRKQIASSLAFDFQGESVGFFRFSPEISRMLASQAREMVEQGNADEPYEEAIRDVLLSIPEKFSYEDITGLPWLEIDFPEDVEKANNEILPKLCGF